MAGKPTQGEGRAQVPAETGPTPKGLSPLAYEEVDGAEYPPYVPGAKTIPELTVKSVVFGVIVGIVFGAANAYLGLKVGLTVSASIPAAVMGLAFFRLVRSGTILEGNIIQTIGSAGESLAAGVIFTFPALFMWGVAPKHFEIACLALIGGGLGVLFMIPLRRFLIVKEHGRLPYPEGTACAEVLVSGETGGGRAQLLFGGLGLGGLYMLLMNGRLFGLWKENPSAKLGFLPGAEVGMEVTPELLGVGYIIGPRIAALMLAGGVLGWLVLIPLIKLFGAGLTAPVYPETVQLIRNMGPAEIWSRYVRYIGAGAVAFGGVFTLIKSLPTIWQSFRAGVGGMKDAGEQAGGRTQRDLTMRSVGLGLLVLIVVMAVLPERFVPVGLLGAIIVTIAAFFFVTVSSRIVGLVGSSSNPVSGMTIATILLAALVFVAMGHGLESKVPVLIIGGIVCVAAAIAGDTSQDLKTGFLLGATPRSQQIGELVGVATSAMVMGGVLLVLAKTYGFGAGPGQLPAPQATLMKLVIEGVLGGKLPWALVLTGVFIAAVVEMLGLPTLALAVGLYLPLELSTPIMVGGLIRLVVEKAFTGESRQAQREAGVLAGSGLIAGGALAGVAVALLVYLAGLGDGHTLPWLASALAWTQGIGHRLSVDLGTHADLVALVPFYLLAVWMAYVAGVRPAHAESGPRQVGRMVGAILLGAAALLTLALLDMLGGRAELFALVPALLLGIPAVFQLLTGKSLTPLL